MALLIERMPLSPCLTCGRATAGPYCPAHDTRNAQRNAKRGAQGTRSAQWRRLRLLVLARDGHICRLRLEGCTTIATTVHLDPALGGNHWIATEADCLSACLRCHGKVDAPRASRGT